MHLMQKVAFFQGPNLGTHTSWGSQGWCITSLGGIYIILILNPFFIIIHYGIKSSLHFWGCINPVLGARPSPMDDIKSSFSILLWLDLLKYGYRSILLHNVSSMSCINSVWWITSRYGICFPCPFTCCHSIWGGKSTQSSGCHTLNTKRGPPQSPWSLLKHIIHTLATSCDNPWWPPWLILWCPCQS